MTPFHHQDPATLHDHLATEARLLQPEGTLWLAVVETDLTSRGRVNGLDDLLIRARTTP